MKTVVEEAAMAPRQWDIHLSAQFRRRDRGFRFSLIEHSISGLAKPHAMTILLPLSLLFLAESFGSTADSLRLLELMLRFVSGQITFVERVTNSWILTTPSNGRR